MKRVLFLTLVMISSCIMAAVALADVPANDDCTNATDAGTLTSGVSVQLSGTTEEATMDCENEGSPEVWIKFTTPDCMDVTIDFCGTDPVRSSSSYVSRYLYDSCPCGEYTYRTSSAFCDDENRENIWESLPAGTYYYPVRYIEGYASYVVNITGVTCATAPENDDCLNATDAGSLSSGVTVSLTGTTSGATQDCELSPGTEVWIKFTLAECMNIAVDFCSDENYLESGSEDLYSECPCLNNYTISTLSYCENGNLSFIWYNLAAGTYYYPIAEQYITSGTYIINVTGTDCPAAPENDDCANAISIGEVTDLAFSTYGASFDGGGECIASANVWYVYTSTFTGDARISIDADYNKRYAIYDGADCSSLPTQLGCTSSSELDFAVITGQSYLIEIGGRNNAVGGGSLTIAEVPETNDDCENATDIGTLVSGVTINSYGSTEDATQDCEESEGPEVWIKFTLPEIMAVTIDYCYCDFNVSYNSNSLFTECPCSGIFTSSDSSECTNGNIGFVWNDLAAGTYYYPIEASYLEDFSYIVSITGVSTGISASDYVPGDINMSNGQWPPTVIGGDVTYLVNYFRGINSACLVGGFFCSADANGDCYVIGSDVTKMVNYFRGLTSLSNCADYEPTWLTPSECPTEAPTGWPNCGE